MVAWTQFANLVNPTEPELDTNLQTLAAMAVFPGTIGGSANALTLTLAGGIPPIGLGSPLSSGYANYMRFIGIALNTNTGNTTFQAGPLAPLTVYKDLANGPQQLTGGEIVQNCAYIFTYDSTLAANAGGFHLSPSSIGGFTASYSTNTPISYTVIPAGTTQDATVNLNGCQIADNVILGLPGALTSGLMFEGRVLANGSVAVRAANITGASIAAFTLSCRVTSVRNSP